MGDVSDGLNCRVLTIVSGEIERIVATYDDTEEAISGIRYYKGLRFVSFGFLDETEKFEWNFDEQNKLIGAHGNIKDGLIVNLGFVVHTTDDELCIVKETVVTEDEPDQDGVDVEEEAEAETEPALDEEIVPTTVEEEEQMPEEQKEPEEESDQPDSNITEDPPNG